MIKLFVWSGVLLFALGVSVFTLFVLPRFGGPPTDSPASGLSVLAVAVSSLSLAAGTALIGIGAGRWRRPRQSPYDGSPEI